MNNQVQFYPVRATQRLMVYLTQAMNKDKPLGTISMGLKNIINSYIGLTKSERTKIYWHYYNLARNLKHHIKDGTWKSLISKYDVFDAGIKIARNIKARLSITRKQNSLVKNLDQGVIFYLCSEHSNPAKDHEPYQGRLYYDRNWRQKVNGDVYYKVMSLIKNRKLISVQKIMGPPVWLITRPYCKHFFIPVSIETALGTSVNKMNKIVGKRKSKPYTREDYFHDRKRVFDAMRKVEDCDEFKRVSTAVPRASRIKK